MRTSIIGLAVAAGLLLGGCSGSVDGEDAEPTRTINTRLSEITSSPPSTPQAWSLEQTCAFLYDPVNSPVVGLEQLVGPVAAGLTDTVTTVRVQEVSAALDEAAERAASELRPVVIDIRDAWAAHVDGEVWTADDRVRLTNRTDTACGPGYVERAG